MINVVRPSLPPLEKYIELLHGIWDRNHLTNAGPLVRQLEDELRQYLSAKHLFYVSNGTIALQIAIRAMEITGEIITTPFSHVATTSSIVWEKCTPVFVDIDPKSLNIDVNKIEFAITEDTQAILATHVYGIPCDVHEIERIAKKHGLKVIYDAAHCFGVTYRGMSLTNYGDISTLSHHATKLFHTVEGGSLITQDTALAHKISWLRNFGQDGPEDFSGLGINGKNSEFHAAMGLCLLPEVAIFIQRRQEISALYDEYLLQDSILGRPVIPKDTVYNYSYYPVILESESVLLETVKLLGGHNIIPRRYFYPSLSRLNFVKPTYVPVAEELARRVLCLPLYETLALDSAKMIAQLVLQSIATVAA